MAARRKCDCGVCKTCKGRALEASWRHRKKAGLPVGRVGQRITKNLPGFRGPTKRQSKNEIRIRERKKLTVEDRKIIERWSK